MPNSLSHLPHEQVDPTKLGLSDQRRWLAGLTKQCEPAGTGPGGLCTTCNGTGEVPLIPKLGRLCDALEYFEEETESGTGDEVSRQAINDYTAAFTVALLEWLMSVAVRREEVLCVDYLPSRKEWFVRLRTAGNISVESVYHDIHAAVVQAAVQVAIARE